MTRNRFTLEINLKPRQANLIQYAERIARATESYSKKQIQKDEPKKLKTITRRKDNGIYKAD